MEVIFIPNHYPSEVWDRYRKSGYKLFRYLAVPAQQMMSIDAEQFLLKGRDIMITSLVQGGNQEDCILAKIIDLNGKAVFLRTDRDYYEICVRDKDGTYTAATWQWAFALRDLRQDELWSNMADFLKE